MHAVHACQKRRQNSQHGHEPPEKHNLPTVLHEEVLAELDLAFSDANSRSVAKEYSIPELLADPVSNVVAKHSPRYRRRKHEPDAQVVGRSGIDPGGNQGRFTRKRHPHALQHYDACNGEIAVGAEEVSDLSRDVQLYLRKQPSWISKHVEKGACRFPIRTTKADPRAFRGRLQ